MMYCHSHDYGANMGLRFCIGLSRIESAKEKLQPLRLMDMRGLVLQLSQYQKYLIFRGTDLFLGTDLCRGTDF